LAGEYKSRLIGPDEVVSAFLASVDQAGAFADSQGRGMAAACGISQGGEDGEGLRGIVNQAVQHIIAADLMSKRVPASII